jgi:tetratricopeptide (TPR) repeat protein
MFILQGASMKFINIFLGLFVMANSLQADWQDHWVKGVALSEKENYVEAELELNRAIEELDLENQSFVYNDRAWAFLKQDKLGEALCDVEKALSMDQKDTDKRTSHAIKMLIHSKTGDYNLAAQALAAFENDNPDLPKIEITKENFIATNIKYPCMKFILKNFLLSTQIVDSEEDILFTETTCIAKKKCECGCKENLDIETNAKKHKHHKKDNQKDKDQQEIHVKEKQIGECCDWCNVSAAGFSGFCLNLTNACCVSACLSLVAFLHNDCQSCCVDGEFYPICIYPFQTYAQNIFEFLGRECDPYNGSI